MLCTLLDILQNPRKHHGEVHLNQILLVSEPIECPMRWLQKANAAVLVQQYPRDGPSVRTSRLPAVTTFSNPTFEVKAAGVVMKPIGVPAEVGNLIFLAMVDTQVLKQPHELGPIQRISLRSEVQASMTATGLSACLAHTAINLGRPLGIHFECPLAKSHACYHSAISTDRSLVPLKPSEMVEPWTMRRGMVEC